MLKRLVVGVLALAGLVVLLAGVPWLLLTVGHYPNITRWPTWQQLQVLFLTPDNGQLLLVAATLVCWLVWLYLAAGFVVELVAALRHIQAPRLPGFALPQLAARTLIAAVALLFASLPLANAASQAAAQPLPQDAAVAPAQALTKAAEQVKVPQEKHATTGQHRYTVKAGDTLTEIAEKRLGHSDRWGDIYQASKHLKRPDGTRFTNPDVLQPGQTLIIPSTTSKVSSIRYTVRDGDTLAEIAQRRLGDAEQWHEIYRASKHLPRPDGTRFSDPDLIIPGQTLIIPKASDKADKAKIGKTTERRTEHRVDTTRSVDKQPVAANPAPAATATPSVVSPTIATSSQSAAASAEPAAQHTGATAGYEHRPMWSTSLGVGTVLAAGVIGLVAWRRRLQLRRGPIGGHVPLPQDDDALAEQQLRAVGDPLAIETVDQALRGLARDCAAAGEPLPLVRAARLTSTQFELYLGEPANLPAPWTGTADASVWRFEADHQENVDVDELHTTPAPYPSLVTIGKDTDEDPGLVFVDLEYLGSLGVTGGRPLTRQAIAALAIELASSPWADDLTVTIVGDYSELEGTLKSGRIRYVPTLERLIDTLERRATEDRVAMAAADVDDVHAARSTATVPDATFPEIVIVATPMTDRQRQRLTDLVNGLPRVAIAAITTDDDPIGDWHLAITGPHSGTLQPIGLAITPQMITNDALDQILTIIHIATHEEAALDATTAPSNITDCASAELILTATIPDFEDARGDDEESIDEPLVSDASQAQAEHGSATAESSDASATDEIDQPAPDSDTAQAVVKGAAGDAPPSDDLDGEQHEPSDAAAEPLEAAVGSGELSGEGLGTLAPRPAVSGEDAQHEAAPVAAMATTAGGVCAAQPSIRVLGPSPELDDARGEAEVSGRRDVSLEAIVYMALHPEASTGSLDVALWPDSDKPASTRAPALSRARRWLGNDDDGNPYLAHHTYRLSSQITTDWARFQQLIAGGIDKTSTTALQQALALVTGRPFSGVRTQSRTPRYTWAEPIRQRMIEAITTVSYELAQRRYLLSDWVGVEAALVRGIEVEPALEHLWRLRIRAAYKRGDATAIQEAITRMTSLAEKLGVDIDPETEELLKAIRHTRILEEAK